MRESDCVVQYRTPQNQSSATAALVTCLRKAVVTWFLPVGIFRVPVSSCRLLENDVCHTHHERHQFQ